MERLKEKVKELRKKKGWLQEDLAREIGVSLPGSTSEPSQIRYR